ncbi:pyridoxine kinase [Parvibaculum indicum]|uniref:pyridoxal kinase n=1 Tax=Parvibaculum indicum TaxID=562969 RepID=UPI001423CE53|nr:pyridoxine kinase [Parvibaculum indicum]
MARILSISSQVVYGAVGNSAGVFALQRLGHEVWPVPTTLLSHHPGYGAPAGGPLSAEEIFALIRSLDEKGWLGHCDAMASGYLAAPDQAEAVLEAHDRLKRANPQALYLCDPVLGDEETGLYAAPGVADAMPALVARADIATPNLFELALLTGRAPGKATPEEMLRDAAPARLCLTSAPAPTGRIGILIREGERIHAVETLRFEPAPKGTGDLFSALVLGRLLHHGEFVEAAREAAASTAAIVRESVTRERTDLVLAEAQQFIARPDEEARLTSLR